MRCLLLFGTRPEAIKLAPLLLALRACSDVTPIAVCTGQHRDMVAPVLDFFGIRPDRTLQLMQTEQSLTALTRRLLDTIPEIIEEEQPHLVLVHGDTTTAMVGALCAHLAGIPVAHIEAGLRTGDLRAPFPEEFNRRAIDAASDWLFAPTAAAAATLAREGHPPHRIFTVGNTATDALRLCLAAPPVKELIPIAAEGKRLLVLTAHRRELRAQDMTALLRAIREEIEGREDVYLLFPVHPAPAVRRAARSAFAHCANAALTDPLPLPAMQQLLARATLLLTDSGGLQEEATYLGLPTLVLRDVTERPEGVAAGVLSLAGSLPSQVRSALAALLDDGVRIAAMAHGSDVYGDGYVSERITELLRRQIFPALIEHETKRK
ncbi:MAG: UDP-N-acetylglucosamine 2-epimerase (non-hydrolyzing) [Clostridia bacterium]|nr:UDP-N-acetylglucosamine 2-epimerase (non-hydrolyzing) [Clostridia bacterium]